MQGEAAMYPPLSRYLEVRGFKVATSIRPSAGSPREYDVVGVKPRTRRTVTIEAKISHFRRAYNQALLRLLVSDIVYVSFPHRYAKHVALVYGDELLRTGIGLLSVDGRSVRSVLRPHPSDVVSAARRDALISMVVNSGA
jgi:hypothetical protein